MPRSRRTDVSRLPTAASAQRAERLESRKRCVGPVFLGRRARETPRPALDPRDSVPETLDPTRQQHRPIMLEFYFLVTSAQGYDGLAPVSASLSRPRTVAR